MVSIHFAAPPLDINSSGFKTTIAAQIVLASPCGYLLYKDY